MEINISELRKLESGGIYLIKTDHELSPGYADSVNAQIDQVAKELGCKFLMIGPDMQVLDAEDARAVIRDAVQHYFDCADNMPASNEVNGVAGYQPVHALSDETPPQGGSGLCQS